MALTLGSLNRATLSRQLLLERQHIGVVEAVARIGAIQAQEPASPYIALWNRVADFDPGELDRAFADRSIIKASLMRVTLHAVTAADHPLLHHAMQETLRGARLHDRRFKATGMSFAEAERIVELLRSYATEPRSNAEVAAWLADELGDAAHPGIWWALRQSASFIHARTGGPWSFGPRSAYVAAPEPTRTGDRVPALAHLVRGYLESFGPATARDIAAYGMLYAPTVRLGLDALGDELTTLEGPGRSPFFDLAGTTLPDEDVPAPPRLLPMWDSTLLAYKERSRMIPEPYRRMVIRANGDVLPTLLVDGFVAGVWRPVPDGIEARAIHPLDAQTWDALEGEARSARALLAGREPLAYGRYARWFPSVPAAEIRILGR